jgi:hypothetical protein
VANSVINLGTVYFLTVAWGIAGTALSGLLAAAVVPFFLHYSHHRTLGTGTWQVFRDCYLRASVAIATVSWASWLVLRPLATSLLVTIALVGVASAAGVLASWLAGAITRDDWMSLRSALSRSTPQESLQEPPHSGGAGPDE